MDITKQLAFSAEQGAYDLHLSAGLPPMIRVDVDVRRVNALNQRQGAGAVLRTIPSEVLSMETLGVGQVSREISMLPRGLVLVTGQLALTSQPR